MQIIRYLILTSVRYLSRLLLFIIRYRMEGVTRSMKNLEDACCSTDTPEEARARKILALLGYCGHYMHFHGGGRSGQAPILCTLAKAGGTLSQQELGMRFDLKPGSLSELLSKLEAAGLIERTRNPSDRRQLFVKLTEEGAAKAGQDQGDRLRFRRHAFEVLTTEEQEQLISALEKVRDHWKEYDAKNDSNAR